MVDAAESLLGPYRWGRYDLLVLPPSFPFGGMENPRLTFATPTILAGDRSLVSLVAHELAHSWSGNLVTNATWRDFWLNEGVTTYVELRIMEALYGPERAAMLRVLARRDLLDEIERLGGPSSPDTVLHIDLDGRDPDDGATRIPYDKGAALMTLLEHDVRPPRFDAYLRSYFDRYAFQSIDDRHVPRRSRARICCKTTRHSSDAAARRVDLHAGTARQRASPHSTRSMPSSRQARGLRVRRTPAAALTDGAVDARRSGCTFSARCRRRCRQRSSPTSTRPSA